ncbi:hypothetical protein KJ973_03695 [Patescibacteria group bacterium]|nr:hypothetical protein [Patescibacteria group bacterium]MBU1246845.1 hypothetical protein [Patescibacteria group bacterium]MBU1519764.1 hypothetical protein [Patescibacteria group bacterium]MBU1730465.1 hypothetical protein [Patescibacteria group bacterium]MBU1956383.1 hypothetical protein [Patescibacteria group bacterium]
MNLTPTIVFKPKQVTKKFLAVLQNRPRFIIINRFGLEGQKKMTLEAIGGNYNITRERVRQIENCGLNAIKKSAVFQKEKGIFDDLARVIKALGGVVSEEDLLNHVSKDPKTQNNVTFLLVLGDEFRKQKEDKEFKHHWSVDDDIAEKVRGSLKTLSQKLSPDELLSESEIIANFLSYLQDLAEQYKNEEIIKRWLGLSKVIDKNLLGEWGFANSPHINVRGIKDYIFWVIRKHGSPMHFVEVAEAITKTFNKKAHLATCHNELIKDKRFVLVGRGLYALKEWGYKKGTVRDVIKNILQKDGPLIKAEIIKRVLKERYVKENTILVNLQDYTLFAKNNKEEYFIL